MPRSWVLLALLVVCGFISLALQRGADTIPGTTAAESTGSRPPRTSPEAKLRHDQTQSSIAPRSSNPSAAARPLRVNEGSPSSAVSFIVDFHADFLLRLKAWGELKS